MGSHGGAAEKPDPGGAALRSGPAAVAGAGGADGAGLRAGGVFLVRGEGYRPPGGLPLAAVFPARRGAGHRVLLPDHRNGERQRHQPDHRQRPGRSKAPPAAGPADLPGLGAHPPHRGQRGPGGGGTADRRQSGRRDRAAPPGGREEHQHPDSAPRWRRRCSAWRW